MAQLFYGHFDSTEDDPRELLAADWARFIAGFVTNGLRNGGTCLQVTENAGMTVKVDNGVANINGYLFEITTDLNGRYHEVVVPPAHPQHPRIDRIVLRLDRRIQARHIRPAVLMGVAAASPVPPALTRSADIWEMSLAQIRVNANALSITQANVTDERFQTHLCGLMNSVLGLDPSAWQGQFDAFMAATAAEKAALLSSFRHEHDQAQAARQAAFDQTLSANRGTWDAFLAALHLDLRTMAMFDFDNAAALPFVTRTANFAGALVDERIAVTASGATVATRTASFLGDGTIVETTSVYDSTGKELLHRAVATTTFHPDGNVTQGVTA